MVIGNKAYGFEYPCLGSNDWNEIHDVHWHVTNLQECRWFLNATEKLASLPGTDIQVCYILILGSRSQLLPHFLCKYVKTEIQKTIILPFVCCVNVEAGLLLQRKNINWLTFGDEILRKISEPKRKAVTGERDKLHNLYSSPNTGLLVG
jgi:hypothetical protein